MTKYRAYAKVTGSKCLGEFEADSSEEAKRLATESENCDVSLCWSCASECEDAEIEEVFVELKEG